MTERALAARFLSLLLAAGLAGAPLAARGEAVLEPSVGDPAPPPASSDAGETAPEADWPAAASPDKSDKPPTLQPGNHLKTITAQEAAGILGKQVIGAAGENIGMVVDVLIDSEGAPQAAIIDFGGFLGVGSRKIAVIWTLLQFRPGDHYAPILLDVTGEDIRAAPEYRPSDADPSVVVAPPEPPPLPAGPPPAVGTPSEPAAPATGETEGSGLPADSSDTEGPEAVPPEQPDDAAPKPEMKPPDSSPRKTKAATDPLSDDEPEPTSAPPAPSAPPDAGQ